MPISNAELEKLLNIKPSNTSNNGAQKKHIHKYEYFGKYTKKWRCGLPTCYHSMPKHMEDEVEGKMSLCWGCECDIILNEENMKDVRPLCDSCKRKSGLSVEEQIKLIKEGQ